MKFIPFVLITALFVSPLTIDADERIYETKDICGRYYASEIKAGEAALLLRLKGASRISARVEQYCNFFR